MKRIILSFLVLAISAMLTGIAGAATIIVDDGLYSSLQAALDNELYDTVVARGTFDIGTEILTITRPVKLMTDTEATINGTGVNVIEVDLTSSGLVEINGLIGSEKKLTLNAGQNGIWIDHEAPYADLTITGCVIEGPGSGTTQAIVNRATYYSVKQIGKVLITHNEISGFNEGVKLFGWDYLEIDYNTISLQSGGKRFSSWGMHIGWSIVPDATYIRHNTVNTPEYAFVGIGPGAVDGVEIFDNTVNASPNTYAGIGLGYGSKNCIIKENVLTGEGYYGLVILYAHMTDGTPSTGNTIQDNDTIGFNASNAHMWLDKDSYDNTVKDNTKFGAGKAGILIMGNSNTIEDNSLNNTGLESGIELLFNYGTNITGNEINRNYINISNSAKAYVVYDSLWFENPQGNPKIDPNAYPHTRNNTISNPIEQKGLWLANIDWYSLTDPNLGNNTLIGFDTEDVTSDLSPENPHAKGSAHGPSPEDILRDRCEEDGGIYVPETGECILP